MKISGYTTLRNAHSMNYPFEQCLRSLASFCDQIVVVDSSDQDDGTSESLERLQEDIPQLEVITVELDWTAPNHGIFDGETKALSRSYCTGDWLYQIDADEIVHELDAPRIKPWLDRLLEMPGSEKVEILSLPVVEYWGPRKIRLDINPWKPRLSRNLPHITHGIPSSHRKIEDGLLYAHHGTDSCDYIHSKTGVPLQAFSTLSRETERLRMAAQHGNKEVLVEYTQAFQSWIEDTPGVVHYSWFSIAEKIRKYKLFYNDFWKCLYNENRDPEWNPFFESGWSTVSESQIKSRGKEIQEGTGGWIFHQPWNGTRVPHLEPFRDHPEVMREWTETMIKRDEL